MRSPPNQLLARLPRTESRAVLAACEAVEFHAGEVIYEPGTRIRDAYFPIGGLVSLVLAIDGKASLQVGLVGSEGLLGLPLLLGVDFSPLQAVVQGAGAAWRIGAPSLLLALGRRPALRRSLHRYLQVRIVQLGQAVACTRFHVVEERLASLLLTTRDRTRRERFHVTHEHLAAMLGVRRVGVTRAAHSLQELGLIQYRRGDLVILDGVGMEAACCICYQADRQAYRRLLKGTA